mmetsp:Transcript_96732/g.167904  ORF Transcript_96732/g.167904 Transcript_96732/m.167904 type:complete len:183 (-) Transcript_96732:105-653(-)
MGNKEGKLKEPEEGDNSLEAKLTRAATSGKFTFETLSSFDGTKLPTYVSVCGKVYDVSTSDNFATGSGSYAMWAGHDCTFALATQSLEAEDANNLDWCMDDLEPQELLILGAWSMYFAAKYKEVGTLEELSKWNFNEAYEAARSNPTAMAGLQKLMEKKDEAPVAKPVEGSPAAADDGVRKI